MFPGIRLQRYFSHGLWLSLLLHGGLLLLLNVKSRVVTLTMGAESGILQATLVDAPANQLSRGQPLRSLEGPKAPTKAEQLSPRAEPPSPLAEKSALKSQKSAKIRPAIAPSKEGTLDQLAKVAEATPPSLKQPTATSKKSGKLPSVKEKKTTVLPLNSGSKAAPATAPQAEAADLDHFFCHLATNVGPGSVRTASAQQCSQYASQIKNAIQANLIKEPGSQGRGCEIALQLAADGTIVRAQARQGDLRVCAAALRAVGMTARVPKPADPVLYDLFKEIVISFEF